MSENPQPREKAQPPYEPPSVEQIDTEAISTTPGANGSPPPTPVGAES